MENYHGNIQGGAHASDSTACGHLQAVVLLLDDAEVDHDVGGDEGEEEVVEPPEPRLVDHLA
jgi:hypothetical protein